MLLYLIRRAATGGLIFLSVTSVCFFLFNMRGAEAVAFGILGPDASPEAISALVGTLGLDQPVLVQYWDWLTGMLTWDFGRSFVSQQDVAAVMSTRVPVTLSLVVVTLVLTVVFATLIGVVAATRGGLLDRGMQTVAVVVGAIPGYWLALVLVIVFSINLGLFPATGFIPIGQSPVGWLSTVILPSIAIALGSIFHLAVWIRSSIIDLQRQDFVRTLRSRGLSQRAVMYRHVLRNTAAPTLQMIGLMIINLLGGAIIVERIFALPGIGTLALQSGKAGDIPVVLAAVTFLVLVVVVVNVVVDILNGFLNPKARTT